MVKRTNWTPKEDEILVQAVKNNLYNKSQAFREASQKLGRKFNGCSNRWYMHLSNPYSKDYVGTIIVDRESKLDNRDKDHTTPVKTKRSLWAKIKALLGL